MGGVCYGSSDADGHAIVLSLTGRGLAEPSRARTAALTFSLPSARIACALIG